MRSVVLAATVATLLAASLPASAALPPQYQRVAEMRAILDDITITDLFGIQRPIERIEYIETDLYRVTSGACHVDVRIVDKPNVSGMVGPRQFEVEPGVLVCE